MDLANMRRQGVHHLIAFWLGDERLDLRSKSEKEMVMGRVRWIAFTTISLLIGGALALTPTRASVIMSIAMLVVFALLFYLEMRK
jgi:hypothetical protein